MNALFFNGEQRDYQHIMLVPSMLEDGIFYGVLLAEAEVKPWYTTQPICELKEILKTKNVTHLGGGELAFEFFLKVEDLKIEIRSI